MSVSVWVSGTKDGQLLPMQAHVVPFGLKGLDWSRPLCADDARLFLRLLNRGQSRDVLCVERCLCSSLCPCSWFSSTHTIESQTLTSPLPCTGNHVECVLCLVINPSVKCGQSEINSDWFVFE